MYLTIVFQTDLVPECEVKKLTAHPAATAMAWEHALNKRRTLGEEVERLRRMAAVVAEANSRFDHYAKINHPADVPTTPFVLLCDLARLVKRAAEVAEKEARKGA